MMECGVSIQDITPDLDGIGMMGWGKDENTAQAAATPLKARAFVFRNPENGKKVVFVCAEIAFITLSIKEGVIKRLKDIPELGYDYENVMLSATHTHSAPGGISHYLIYNLTIPGFCKDVCDIYINGIVQAILEADKNLQPASAYLSRGEIDPEERVAFNRAVRAYNMNPEVEKISHENRHLAVDREMTLVRIENAHGKPMGMVNWFAVHCTSIHSDNHLIHFDNKGYAAQFFEADFTTGNPGFVGAFAQSSCGDVSPNFQYFPGMKFCRGEYEDDFESARFNGRIQYNKARELFNSNSCSRLSGQLDYIHMFVDFSNVEIDPEFANGEEGHRTGPAAIGVSMLKGTAEGPGISERLHSIMSVLAVTISLKEKTQALVDKNLRLELKGRKEIHGNKKIFAETGKRKILGENKMGKLIIPESADPVIKRLKDLESNNAIGNKPWTPNILPVQLFIIGELAIAALPGEFTTIAARRLKHTIMSVLSERGVKKVVLSCYSNAYAGYVTTKEEYELQLYEGGSTHFGKWTLAAYQTKFKYLANQLLKKPEEREITSYVKPHGFDDQELSKRAFVKIPY